MIENQPDKDHKDQFDYYENEEERKQCDEDRQKWEDEYDRRHG